MYDRVDSVAQLREMLEALERTGRRPEAIIFTGDLADRGEPAAYAELAALAEPVAERLGARIVWGMGNHDQRAAFRSELMGGMRGEGPVDHVVWSNGLRIIMLDTSVPGEHHGELEDSQLAWLAEKFEAYSDEPVDRDALLTNVMLYWLTGTANSSSRIYAEMGPWAGETEMCEVPTAVAVFPKDTGLPVRHLAERTGNIVRWTNFEHGGHFPGLEQPEALVGDLRAFFRELRPASHRL